MNTFSINVSGFGFFWGIKHPKMNSFAVDSNARRPSFLVFCSAHVAMSIRRLRAAVILAVYRVSYVAKVAKAVVSFNAIDMVDTVSGKHPRHVKPCQSVRVSDFTGYVNNQMSVSIRSANNIANFGFSTDGNDSSENTCFWVVMKNLFKAFLGKHGITLYHKVVSKKESCREGDKSTFQPLSLGNKPIISFI